MPFEGQLKTVRIHGQTLCDLDNLVNFSDKPSSRRTGFALNDKKLKQRTNTYILILRVQQDETLWH